MRHGRELALAVLDLDHFKDVNDVHGHMAGDDVLREAALRLASRAREGDVLARLGGEEFAWLCRRPTGWRRGRPPSAPGRRWRARRSPASAG